MTEKECFEQLIGYVADQREALEKGRAIDDTDLYNIDVLLVRLQDQCAKNKSQLFVVRNWMVSEVHEFKTYDEAIKKYNEIYNLDKDHECDLQLYQVLKDFNNLKQP